MLIRKVTNQYVQWPGLAWRLIQSFCIHSRPSRFVAKHTRSRWRHINSCRTERGVRAVIVINDRFSLKYHGEERRWVGTNAGVSLLLVLGGISFKRALRAVLSYSLHYSSVSWTRWQDIADLIGLRCCVDRRAMWLFDKRRMFIAGSSVLGY